MILNIGHQLRRLPTLCIFKLRFTPARVLVAGSQGFAGCATYCAGGPNGRKGAITLPSPPPRRVPRPERVDPLVTRSRTHNETGPSQAAISHRSRLMRSQRSKIAFTTTCG